MSVVLETTLGDITVDLYVDERPKACLNFLKLCTLKYYNFNLFHTVNHGFIAQTGDPTGSGEGGESIWGVLEGDTKRYFEGENVPRIKHTRAGLISFVGDKNSMIGSQFFITLADDLTYLDGQHCVFGEVAEGFDILRLLNEAICDNDHRPYQDIRITHTVILSDPFPNPDQLVIPDASPEPTADRLRGGRIAPDEDIDETVGKSKEEVLETIADKEAKARATILEMIGDIPDADMAPPENVLFVCKLNPVTNDDDLEIIFSRFGKIKSCEVIRDKKTGDSLQYAFVEFDEKKSCEDAYFKMDNVLIDDRRIHVDFSQSVAKVKWLGKGRGVQHYNDKGERENGDPRNDVGNGRYHSSKHEFRSKKSNNRSRSKSYENDRNDRKTFRNESKRYEEHKTRYSNYDRDMNNRDNWYRNDRYRNDRYGGGNNNYRRNNFPQRRQDYRFDDRNRRGRSWENNRSRNYDRPWNRNNDKYRNKGGAGGVGGFKRRQDFRPKYDDNYGDRDGKRYRRYNDSEPESNSDEEQASQKKLKKHKKESSKRRKDSESGSDSETDSEKDYRKSSSIKKKKSKRPTKDSSESESDDDAKKKKFKKRKNDSSESDSDERAGKRKKNKKRKSSSDSDSDDKYRKKKSKK